MDNPGGNGKKNEACRSWWKYSYKCIPIGVSVGIDVGIGVDAGEV